MSATPFAELAAPLDRATREAIAATKPHPHGMPSRPFDRSRLALWPCPCGTYGVWNDPQKTTCRTCDTPRGTNAP